MTMTPQERIDACRNLDELCATLRGLTDEETERVDITELPVYGREYNHDTYGIWSWDDNRVLVGTARDGSAWGIERRCAVCGAARFMCDCEE